VAYSRTTYQGMVKGIILILLTWLYLPAFSQTDTISYTQDTLVVAKGIDFRVPDQKKIEEFRNDSRFDYKKVERAPSVWDRIKYRIYKFFRDLFGAAIDSGVPGIIVILVVVLIICLIILKVLGVDYKTVLGRKKIDTPEIDIYSENVHEMDFDTLISNALKNKDYRLAIRFLYLKNLKFLSDKEIINWNANKTNYSYQYEISNSILRSKFLETTLIFDYIWYGEFSVDEQRFSDINIRMNSFNKMITDER